MALGGERSEVASEARAEQERPPRCDQRLDDRELARDRHVREIRSELGNDERQASIGEPRAEELRLGAERARGEAVEVDEIHAPSVAGAGLARYVRSGSRTDTRPDATAVAVGDV